MATTNEELLKKEQVKTDASNNVANGAYNTARLDAINKMYDAQQAARESELKSAYDQSLSAYKAAQDKIAPQYQASANDLATQYERNRRNFNQQAIGNGINTGAGSQAALAQNNEYLRAFGNLRASESEALAESERKAADLKAQYESSLAASKAQNEYNRSGAVLDEHNAGYQRDLQQAQILAEYGDFSGYANLYGKEQADAMFMLWAAQNPDFAFNSGKITRDQYKVMTGKDPVGWTATGLSINDLVDGKIPAGVGGGAFGSGGDPGWSKIGWGTYDPSGSYDPNAFNNIATGIETANSNGGNYSGALAAINDALSSGSITQSEAAVLRDAAIPPPRQ